MSAKIIALSDDNGVIEQLALFTEYGAYTRDDGDWVELPVEIEDGETDIIDGLNATDTTEDFLPLFDMAEDTNATLTVHDIP